MTTFGPADDVLVEQICSVLRLYQWRSFTPELLARSLLAARDRRMLAAVLAAVPGAVTGDWDVLEPAERTDGRVAGLVDFLEAHPWTDLTLSALCKQLLAQVDRGA